MSSLKNIRAVSFDADGTLLGTFSHLPYGFETFFLEAARTRGKEIILDDLSPILARLKEETQNKRDLGFKPYISEENARAHWLWFYEEVFKALQLPEPAATALELIQRYESGEFTRLYEDTLPCLKNLKAKKIPMIVISNFAPLLERFLEELGIADYFKAVLISGHTGIEKPDLEIFDMGAKILQAKPSEILHIGNDPKEDYEGATQAGYQALLLDREGRYVDYPVPKISSLRELKRLPRSREKAHS